MINEIEVVLNRAFGGFSLDLEMVTWLTEHKGWIVKSYDEHQRGEFCHLIDHGHSSLFYPPNNISSTIEFRSNPDLIECVRTLQKLYGNDNYTKKITHQVCNLRVVKFEVTIEVEDYNDGYERLNFCGYET